VSPPPDRLVLPARPLPNAGFTTVVAQAGSLAELVNAWGRGQLDIPGASPPNVLPFPEGAETLTDPFRVAVIQHAPGDELIRVLVSRWFEAAGLRAAVDLGFWLRPASDPPRVADAEPQVTWLSEWSEDLIDTFIENVRATSGLSVPVGAMGAGQQHLWPTPVTVVCIDTGDAMSADQMTFEMTRTVSEPPIDLDGHGSAVGSLIRLTFDRLGASQVHLRSFRVLQARQSLIDSGRLLNALTFATTSLPVLQVICAALRADTGTRDLGSRDTFQMLVSQRRDPQVPAPVVVAAAGNTGPHEHLALPAEVPGIVVARGLDEQNEVAKYNCIAQPGIAPAFLDAPGGTELHPIGSITGSDGETRAVHGSSFAAALITAAIAASTAHVP
jgi:hypothetical protein